MHRKHGLRSKTKSNYQWLSKEVGDDWNRITLQPRINFEQNKNGRRQTGIHYCKYALLIYQLFPVHSHTANSNVVWHVVGPTSVLLSRRWAKVGPTSIVVMVYSYWKQHTSKWIEAVLSYEWPSQNPIPFDEVHCSPIELNHPTSNTVLPHNWWKCRSIWIKAIWKYMKDLTWRSDKVLSLPLILTCLGQLFQGSVDFYNWPKGNVLYILCSSHSAVSCRCMQITISNQSKNHANQYPACNH